MKYLLILLAFLTTQSALAESTFKWTLVRYKSDLSGVIEELPVGEEKRKDYTFDDGTACTISNSTQSVIKGMRQEVRHIMCFDVATAKRTKTLPVLITVTCRTHIKSREFMITVLDDASNPKATYQLWCD